MEFVPPRRVPTCPSQKATWTLPPSWKLNISSLGPQLLVVIQGQPGGPLPPFVGKLLLLTATPKVPAGGPETPKPESGSAQRQKARRPLLPIPMGSGYGDTCGSTRPQSSAMAMVLLVPSLISASREPPS